MPGALHLAPASVLDRFERLEAVGGPGGYRADGPQAALSGATGWTLAGTAEEPFHVLPSAPE